MSAGQEGLREELGPLWRSVHAVHSQAMSEGWDGAEYRRAMIAALTRPDDQARELEALIRQVWVLAGGDGRVRASVVENAIRRVIAARSLTDTGSAEG